MFYPENGDEYFVVRKFNDKTQERAVPLYQYKTEIQEPSENTIKNLKDLSPDVRAWAKHSHNIGKVGDEIRVGDNIFKIGEVIDVNYKGEGKWYRATFRGLDRKRRTDTFSVEYFDTRDKILGVNRDSIRKLTAEEKKKHEAKQGKAPAWNPVDIEY